MLTDTFAGIRPDDAPLFIVAQVAGVFIALAIYRLLWSQPASKTH
jgi:glycerol uptake facilitator-like aquaporin